MLNERVERRPVPRASFQTPIPPTVSRVAPPQKTYKERIDIRGETYLGNQPSCRNHGDSEKVSTFW